MGLFVLGLFVQGLSLRPVKEGLGLCRHHRQRTVGVDLIHVEIKLMRRAVIAGLIFAAQTPAAEVKPGLAVSAQGGVIFMHIKLAGILPGQTVVEQKPADALVPALRRRPGA